MGSNDFPGARHGDRLNARNINRWIAGSKRELERSLEGLVPAFGRTLEEPALKCFALNTSSTVIPAGAPVSLEEVTEQSEVRLLNQRCFNIVLLEDAETVPTNAGVAVNYIPANGAGEVYISGVCLARLTDDNADLVAAAGLTTLWQEGTAGDRYAIVRFGGASVDYSTYIVGGQTLSTYNGVTTYGITKHIGILSGITTQVYSPGECNPTTGAEAVAPSPAITAWPAGLGYGTLIGASGYSRAIVVNDDRAGTATLLVGSSTANPTFAPSIMEGRIYSTRTGPVTLADGTSITAVIPDFG